MKKKTKKSKNYRYIRLYRDEFDLDTWKQYCKIIKCCPSSTMISVSFKPSLAFGIKE